MVSYISHLVGHDFWTRQKILGGAVGRSSRGTLGAGWWRPSAPPATPGRGTREVVAGRMGSQARTCVMFLTMHRSGSSATVRVLQTAGLALGSAPLLGPHPSNPYGHFESTPCVELNRMLQRRLFGFDGELPPSRELLFPFLRAAPLIASADRYACAADFRVGERIAEMVSRSGAVAGLKDPRVPLLWGFWRRIMDGMAGVNVVPVLILRSPHAIACSIAARSGGFYSYSDGLLATERHLRCIHAIAQTFPAVHVVRFGTNCYETDLTRVAGSLDLTLTSCDIDQCIDQRCIHFAGEAVDHPAQVMYDELCGRYGH